VRLVARTASQPLLVMDSSGIGYWPPALFTKPKFPRVDPVMSSPCRCEQVLRALHGRAM
jgi:hypothetical protein